MVAIPEGQTVKHRYAIETDNDTYPCDNYTIYVGQGVLCICVYPEYTDVFMIVGPVVAFHDFSSGINLDKFEEQQKADQLAAKAVKKPTNSAHKDANYQ